MDNFPATEKTDSFFDFLSLEPFPRFVEILANNLIVALKILILGILSYGIISALLLFYNGLILGLVLNVCAKTLSLQIILASTLPHVGEVFGLVLSGYVGHIISVSLLSKKRVICLSSILIWSLISLLLIIVSAFSESYISMSLPYV